MASMIDTLPLWRQVHKRDPEMCCFSAVAKGNCEDIDVELALVDATDLEHEDCEDLGTQMRGLSKIQRYRVIRA